MSAWRRLPLVKRSKTRKDNVVRITKRLSKSELNKMIVEALVDAYGESEQITAFYTMIEENMSFPFESVILGAKVQIEKVDLTDDERRALIAGARAHDARPASSGLESAI